MAGRRLRDAVKRVLYSGGSDLDSNAHIVIAGLANTYSQYVTTFEEYQVQRYEVCIVISKILIWAKLNPLFKYVCMNILSFSNSNLGQVKSFI